MIGNSKKQTLLVPQEYDNNVLIAVAMTNVVDVELSTNGEDISLVTTKKGSKRNYIDQYHSTSTFNVETPFTATTIDFDNAGTIKTYSNLDTLMLLSDFKRDVSVLNKVTYTPDSDANSSSLELKFIKENVLRNISGAKSSLTLSGNIGKPLSATFNLSAYANLVPDSANYNQSVPSATLENLVVINKITGITIGGDVINMSSFTINQNSEIQDTYATNVAGFSNTDFDFQIEITALRVKNDISHWLAFRNEDLKEIVISATTLDTTRAITITVPSAKLINLADGDDAGRQTIVRTYRCQNVLGDDNIKIEIQKGL